MYPKSHQDNDSTVIAHMSPSEVRELLDMQGEPDSHPSGLPYFEKLEKIFFQPEFQKELNDWHRKGFAGGGEVDGVNDFIRKSGRNGDTMAVVLPKSIADLFDYALGGGTQNPHTGKREYFLGGLLGGLKNIFSKVAGTVGGLAQQAMPMIGGLINSAAPAVGGMLQSALGSSPLGAMAGSVLGRGLTDAGHFVGSALQGGQLPNPSDVARQAGMGAMRAGIPAATTYAQNAMQNYQQRQTPGSLPALLSAHANNLIGQGANHLQGYND